MRVCAALSFAALTYLATLVPLAASAAPERYGARHPQRLDQLLPHIRATHPGTFYDAEGPFEAPDGRLHYRLKWLTPSGRLIWLDADAESGAVLGVVRGPMPAQRFDRQNFDRQNVDRQDFRRSQAPEYRRDDRDDRRRGDRQPEPGHD